ncbi:MAG: ATP phosphoribosyltransferase regulatory subunit [Limnobacter sp.]|nr:ATP phosphoribosyltransferase regulatory subunit [Limnobacter sp.]
MSAWLLPESVADVLPSEARRIEELRRIVLDHFRVYGYELVMPPLLEYTESLLSQADQSLDLQTFKLLDQASGRMLGVRADTTPQVARIDAHILNRAGATRLCYCGPVLHTHARGLHTTREPLQCGAELYGCAGIQADLEIISLASEVLGLAGLNQYRLAFSHAGLVPALLGDVSVKKATLGHIHSALAFKDEPALRSLLVGLPQATFEAISKVPRLYGRAGTVLKQAREQLPQTDRVVEVLNELKTVSQALEKNSPGGLEVMLDLADIASFDYHSGLIFSAYTEGCPNPVLRGGRYDDVGSVYGRARPATGFSVDLRELVALTRVKAEPLSAIRAPWGSDPLLLAKIRELRLQGEVVVQSLPETQTKEEEFICDRVLVADENGGWTVVPDSHTGDN